MRAQESFWLSVESQDALAAVPGHAAISLTRTDLIAMIDGFDVTGE